MLGITNTSLNNSQPVESCSGTTNYAALATRIKKGMERRKALHALIMPASLLPYCTILSFTCCRCFSIRLASSDTV